VLCKNRSKNGSGNHQHEDHIEQTVIDQALTGGVSSIEGDKRGRECGRHLRQRERPHRHARDRRIGKGATHSLCSYPLAYEQRADDR